MTLGYFSFSSFIDTEGFVTILAQKHLSKHSTHYIYLSCIYKFIYPCMGVMMFMIMCVAMSNEQIHTHVYVWIFASMYVFADIVYLYGYMHIHRYKYMNIYNEYNQMYSHLIACTYG